MLNFLGGSVGIVSFMCIIMYSLRPLPGRAMLLNKYINLPCPVDPTSESWRLQGLLTHS